MKYLKKFIISNKDRLIRFGYELFERFIKEKDSQIIRSKF